MLRKSLKLAAIIAAAVSWNAGDALANKANDTLVWTTTREAAVADPYYNNTRELVVMGHMAWDALLYRDIDTGEFKPLLATSWKWVDNVTMDVELRKGVKFHDGSDLDAEDVAYTINHTSNKNNGVLSHKNVAWMKNAEVTGSHSVRIHLHKPFPAALAFLSNVVFIMPSGHYDSAPTRADGKKDYGVVKPVGTGPYMITEVKAGEYIMMKKNPNYFEGSPKGKPQIGNIKFRTIKEMNTQIAELLTGGIDWMWDVPKDQAERLEAQGTVTVENAKTMRVSYLAFDVDGSSNTKVFMDKRVRMAVAHAINRESITKNLVGPASAVIPSACHPDQFGCAQDVAKWDYNPEKSKALLKEAGLENGFEFDIFAYRQREFTEAVIGDLAKVGIKAKLNFMQYRALRDLVWKGKTPINHMTWGSNSIPDVSAITSHFFSGGRDDPAKDPATAKALEEGDTSTDPEARKAAYKRALSIISSELYWLPMFTYAKYYVFSKELDFKTTPDEIPRFYSAKWK